MIFNRVFFNSCLIFVFLFRVFQIFASQCSGYYLYSVAFRYWLWFEKHMLTLTKCEKLAFSNAKLNMHELLAGYAMRASCA